MSSGIYQFINKINGKIYVGQAQDLELRRKHHIAELRSNRHGNTHLQAAWNKYGEAAFEWSVLEYCDTEELDSREIFWIAEKNSYFGGYNQTQGGYGARGRTQSLFEREVRRKATEAAWGNPEHRERRLASMRAVMETPEYRAHISQAAKATWDSASDEWKNRIIGRMHAPESRAKAKASLQRMAEIPEERNRLAETSRTAWSDPETKRKWAESRKELNDSLDYLRKLGEARRKTWDNSKYRETTGAKLIKARKDRTRPILQVETGIVFASMSDAVASLGKSNTAHVCDCCYGKRNSAYGYHWKFADQSSDAQFPTRRTKSHRKKVICVETGQVFNTAKEAGAFVDRQAAGISECCNGHRKTCGGFHWKWIND